MQFKHFYETVKDNAKKVVVARLNCHHQGNKKDILILSSPRSGSTWLMETFYAVPGTKYIYEPLARHTLNRLSLIGLPKRLRYANLTESEGNLMKEYLRRVDKMNLCGLTNIFSKDYDFFTNRRVIKIIRANALVEWFAHELEVHVVYIIRHPIPQSLSCIQRGKSKIGCWISEYMDNDEYVKQNINKRLERFIKKIQGTGSDFEKFVTEWCLANLIALKNMNNNKWCIITYEELVLRYKDVINMLFKEFDIEAGKPLSLKKVIPSKTSDSSDGKTREEIIKGETRFLLEKWKKNISEQQENNVFNILQEFEIDAYKAGKFLPHKKLLHFLHE
ncbi:MAG: hypothetical protein GY797_38205 [Deltaproteobacteria bacterium]|nr:hypothetical protein [Deltaproteobacteria bacterium]